MRGTVRPEAAISRKGFTRFFELASKRIRFAVFYRRGSNFGLSQLRHSDGDPLALIAQNRKLRTQLI